MLREVLKIDIPTKQFIDVATLCRYASIAGSLDFCGGVLGIGEDKAKMAVGRRLIAKFCMPKKGVFRDWISDPEDWALFESYCCQDVLAERAIYEKLKAFHLPTQERKIWILDQEINRRGIPVDMNFVEKSSRIVKAEHDDLTAEFKALTGLENPNSVSQLLGWLKTQGYEYGSLGAKWVVKGLADGNTNVTARRALELRQLLAKSSTAKLETLSGNVGSDGNLRNQYIYYGAARTGRWSGRSVQLQNLPRGTIKDPVGAVPAILSGDRTEVMKFGPPIDVVSSCLRSAFRAPAGKIFVVCDLGAIENRVLGWISDCPEINNVFAQGRDPYLSFAVHLYKTPYETLLAEYKAGDKNKRQIAKPGSLGCGYQLSGGEEREDKNGDTIKTGLWGYAEAMHISMTQEEAHWAVETFRNTYHEVVALWRKTEKAALLAIESGMDYSTGRVVFRALPNKLLYLTLPSGRRLHYIRPQIETEEGWSSKKLSYEGNLIGKTWGRKRAYGGLWTENICQSIARDVLAAGMLRAKEAGFTLVGSTHDEIIALEDKNSSLNLSLLKDMMTAPIDWAPGLLLDADGFTDEVYRK
jgi:DNA polymerase